MLYYKIAVTTTVEPTPAGHMPSKTPGEYDYFISKCGKCMIDWDFTPEQHLGFYEGRH